MDDTKKLESIPPIESEAEIRKDIGYVDDHAGDRRNEDRGILGGILDPDPDEPDAGRRPPGNETTENSQG